MCSGGINLFSFNFIMIDDLVSIIIPSYNCCDYLQKMISCVVNQTYKKWELVIVDDNSTDNTNTILEEYCKIDSRIKFFIRGNNIKGAQTCRNIGFEKSNGEYVCFFDADDLIAPYCLEQRVEYIKRNSHLDFAVFPAIGFSNKPYDRNDIVFGIGSDNTLKDFVGRRLPFVVWNNIYRKSSIKQAGLIWDPHLLSLQDSDYNLQSLLKGFKYEYASGGAKIDYYYRIGNNQNSISKKIISLAHIQSHSYFFNKLIDSLGYKLIDKFFDEIISYIFFFFNISIKSGNYNLIQEILHNKLIRNNYCLYYRLIVVFKLSKLLPSFFSLYYFILFPLTSMKSIIKMRNWGKERRAYLRTIQVNTSA